VLNLLVGIVRRLVARLLKGRGILLGRVTATGESSASEQSFGRTEHGNGRSATEPSKSLLLASPYPRACCSSSTTATSTTAASTKIATSTITTSAIATISTTKRCSLKERSSVYVANGSGTPRTESGTRILATSSRDRLPKRVPVPLMVTRWSQSSVFLRITIVAHLIVIQQVMTG
jgi:hypothetical protein